VGEKKGAWVVKVITERCDVCGKLREAVGGNWWSGEQYANGASVVKFMENDEDIIIHLCCIKCATTWFDNELKRLTPSVE
jgi:hypothetical protein